MREKSLRRCECGEELRVEYEAVIHYDISPKTGRISRKPSVDVDPGGQGYYIYCTGKCSTRTDLVMRNGRIYPSREFMILMAE
jgi:hypothetical protein